MLIHLIFTAIFWSINSYIGSKKMHVIFALARASYLLRIDLKKDLYDLWLRL